MPYFKDVLTFFIYLMNYLLYNLLAYLLNRLIKLINYSLNYLLQDMIDALKNDAEKTDKELEDKNNVINDLRDLVST